MTQSRETEIDYFLALTNWKDEQRVIDFLTVYGWNLEFAIDGYLTNDTLNNNDQLTSCSFNRMNSTEKDSQSSDEEQELNHTLIDSSPRLYNSLNQVANTSNRNSFDDHINQLEVSNVRTIFPEINKLYNNKLQLLQYIDMNVIGKNVLIKTPFATLKLIYADYTASGRSLLFFEHYMLTYVLPYYANTHSENNACASQTTKFRESSRRLIKQCVNANDNDVVIFTGSGSTAAVNKLVGVLNLRDEQIRKKTVVFISAFEHHSNILPWKETKVEVIRIPNNNAGLFDQDILKEKLEHYHNQVKKYIICSFNAASNVTGIRTDVDSISTLVHRYNGYIFWDYAAAAPYVRIDMNPSKTAYKDAVFISTHKFVGGPGTPGLLIAKRKLFTNEVPCDCGGGTVDFVTRTQTAYVKDIETREEGGTPNILGSIRAGLVFHLKQSIGDEIIEARENELVKKFFKRFRNHSTLFVLGPPTADRLAIFSFLIYVPSMRKYLHHNFICVLLNDLFGIQVRSGCSCAGPYVLDLLNIDNDKAEIYTKFLSEDNNEISKNTLMKPGFTRFNLSYFASDEEVDYILNAIEFIATDGWIFLPLYSYDINTAIWRPLFMSSENHSSYHHHHSLQMITYDNGTMEQNQSEEKILKSNFRQLIISSSSNDPFDQARSMAMNIPKYVYENIDYCNDMPLNIPDNYKDFIWFVTPKEIVLKILIQLEQEQQNKRRRAPFILYSIRNDVKYRVFLCTTYRNYFTLDILLLIIKKMI